MAYPDRPAAAALAGTAAGQTTQRLEADTLTVLRCTSGEATVATFAADVVAAPGQRFAYTHLASGRSVTIVLIVLPMDKVDEGAVPA